MKTFIDCSLLGPGRAFHYTSHGQEIEAARRFFGAPINANLDQTQMTIPSPAATADPGVVFAYADLQSAIDEAFGDQVYEIEYSAAVQATHQQEAGSGGAPPTILVVNRDIRTFRLVR